MKNQTNSYIVAGLLAAFLISAPVAAIAGTQVPFNGTVSGNIVSTVPVDQFHLVSEATNGGIANQLGHFTGTAEFVLDVRDFTYVGSYVFTAANGDSISGPFFGSLTPTSVPGVFDNTETAFITSGTGRFTNATGTFYLGGQIDNNTETFRLPWQGTISNGNQRH